MTTRINKMSVSTDRVNVTANFKNKNIRCMYCTLPITSDPVGCPIKIKEKISSEKHSAGVISDEFVTTGMFCGYNCVCAYIFTKQHDALYRHSYRYLLMMATRNSGSPVTEIIPSPDIQLMSCYGGVMSEEQYAHSIGRVKYVNNGIMLPVTHIYTKIEQI